MHFHLPKPLHGWREFAGEVGIIVVGVLIALAAEQLVETAHWHSELRDFRKAVDHEVAVDLGTYQFRLKENPCVTARLADLQAWLDSARAGHQAHLSRPIGVPRSLSLQTSAWQSRDANVVAHMSLDERLALGILYDEFGNNEAHRLDERETWLRLGEFDGASQLTAPAEMQLQGLINRARYRQERMTQNAVNYFPMAARLGIKPIWQSDFGHFDPGFCRRMYAQSADKKA